MSPSRSSVAVPAEAHLRCGGYLRRFFDLPHLNDEMASALRRITPGDRACPRRRRARLGASHRGIRRRGHHPLNPEPRGDRGADVRQVRVACRPALPEPPNYLASAGDCGARGVEEVGGRYRRSARGAEEAREALKKRTLPTYWRRLEAAEGDSFVLSPKSLPDGR